MGWMPAGFEFYIPAVGESESYHFELAAPTDLEVARSILHLKDPVTGWEDIEGVSTGTRAHLYTTGKQPDVDGTALVWLQISRTGFLRSGCVVAGMICAVLLFFYATGRSAEVNRVTSRIFHGKVVTRQPSDVLASLKRLKQERA